MRTAVTVRRRLACETRRKRTARGARPFVLCAVVAMLAARHADRRAGAAEAQPAAADGNAQRPNETHAADEAHAAGEEHGGGVMDVVARLVNFAILVGTLVYLLRSPFATYLTIAARRSAATWSTPLK